MVEKIRRSERADPKFASWPTLVCGFAIALLTSCNSSPAPDLDDPPSAATSTSTMNGTTSVSPPRLPSPEATFIEAFRAAAGARVALDDASDILAGVGEAVIGYAESNPVPAGTQRGSREQIEWTIGCVENQAVSITAYETGFGVALLLPADENDVTIRPQLVLIGCEVYPEALGLLEPGGPFDAASLEDRYDRQLAVVECLKANDLPFDEPPSFDAYADGGGRWDAYVGDSGTVSFGMDIRRIPDSLIDSLPEGEQSLIRSIQTCPVVLVGLPIED